MSKRNYKKMIEESAQSDVILGSYGIAAEGMDIGALNTLVLINSCTDIEQPSGRILRGYQNRYPPLIVDIVDECGNFPRHASTRKRYYMEEGYICTTKHVYLTAKEALNPALLEPLETYIKNIGDDGDVEKKKPTARGDDLPPIIKDNSGKKVNLAKTCVL